MRIAILEAQVSTALKPVEAWLSGHGDDLLVELIGGLPFLLFDVLIIVVLLPLALDVYRKVRTRHLRAVALAQLCAIHSSIRSLLANGSHWGSLEADPIEHRKVFESAISEARQRLSTGCPIYMGLLDDESATMLLKANHSLEYVIDFLIYHVTYPAERIPSQHQQWAESIAWSHYSELNAMERRVNRLMRKPLFEIDEDPERSNPLVAAVEGAMKLRRRGWTYEGPNSILIPRRRKGRAQAAKA
ncbi:hypothetical protein [Brevundimonas sp.]|uniref:hypothetical protein n=1 Tax=Brevundimonas sp. TaxID=1871086 RepID=UPI00272F5C69|nr:hypothetical protein [Brevundimonas sp.]MDP1912636.1 hypothetical protein [Brevundimonas sp.]